MKRVRLIELRKAANLTQAEVADRIGLKSGAYISMLENGFKDPSMSVAHKLANLFNVTVDEIFLAPNLTTSEPTSSDSGCISQATA